MKKKILLVSAVLFLLIIFLLLANFLKNKVSADTLAQTHPLPYMVHWDGTRAREMLGLTQRGHAVIPTFPSNGQPTWDNYSVKDLLAVKKLNLPVDMIGPQWESTMYTDPQYTDIDRNTATNTFTGSSVLMSENPLNIFLDNTFTNSRGERKLDPIGPEGQIEKWRGVGRSYANLKSFKFLQEAYPNPPSVNLAGNNEAGVIFGTSAANLSKRFNQVYPNITTQIPDIYDLANFGNRVVGDGWIERYGAMFQTWRNETSNPTWKNLKFTSYLGYLSPAFRKIYTATWGTGMSTFSTYEGDLLPDTNNSVPRLCYNFYVWDGSSPEFYLNFDGGDTNLAAGQIGSMNWVFAEKAAKLVNPNHYLELSTWDGDSICQPDTINPYHWATNNGVSAARYAAAIQYATWVARPQAIREFRFTCDTWEKYLPQFLELTKIVDRVHQNSVLKDFWQNGELVENPVGHHPFQDMTMADGFSDTDIREKYGVGRWFYLYSNLDASKRTANGDGSLGGFKNDYDYRVPSTNIEIPVFSLALVRGQAPTREWLVYSHSPKQDRTGVTVTVPGFGDISINPTIAGSFYLLKESDRSITAILDESAKVAHLISNFENPIVAPGAQLQLNIIGAKDQYDYDIAIPGNLHWSANGGVIDQTGLFTAGNIPGDFEVIVSSGDMSEKIPVRVGNLMGYWRFDGAAGSYVSDSSGRDNGCYNYRNWDSDGKFGSAGSFDGNWYGASCDADDLMLAPKELTISAWFKKTAGGGGGYIFNAVNANASLGYALSFNQEVSTGKTSIQFVGNVKYITIQEGEWHHLIAVYKAGQYAKLFMDGAMLLQDNTVSSAITKGTDRIQIGNNFIGSVDQVRLYNQALSDVEIQSLYNEIPSANSNLTLAKAVDKFDAKAGDTINYTITYQNIGNEPLKNAVISDVISDNLNIINAPGAIISGRSLSWTISSIPANSSPQTLTVQCTIK